MRAIKSSLAGRLTTAVCLTTARRPHSISLCLMSRLSSPSSPLASVREISSIHTQLLRIQVRIRRSLHTSDGASFTYPTPSARTEQHSTRCDAQQWRTIASSTVPFCFRSALKALQPWPKLGALRFYTYFDRSLYTSDSPNSTFSGTGSNLTDASTSNIPLQDASAVCTWSQTRFLVQIWTQKPDVASLNATVSTKTPADNSSANDMVAPGSFPYSITITLDRHGGDADGKGVYCYGLNEKHHVMKSKWTWVAEDRGFGGTLLNPAKAPNTNGTSLSRRDDNGGGIDAGTGGCSCQWENWR